MKYAIGGAVTLVILMVIGAFAITDADKACWHTVAFSQAEEDCIKNYYKGQ